MSGIPARPYVEDAGTYLRSTNHATMTVSAMRLSTMISSHLFEAYLECPTKCWLRAQNEPATGNVYAEWGRAQNESYRKEWVERRVAIVAEADRALSPTFEANPKEATWRFAVDMACRPTIWNAGFRRWNGLALRDAHGTSNLSRIVSNSQTS